MNIHQCSSYHLDSERESTRSASSQFRTRSPSLYRHSCQQHQRQLNVSIVPQFWVSRILTLGSDTFIYMQNITCGISSLLHSVNLILSTVLLFYLILPISPHHSHHLRSHHQSLHRPFTPDLKLISFTNPFLHSYSYFLPDCLHGSEPLLN